MIDADVDLKKLERDLAKVVADFGDENQSAVARWGVAVCRRLVETTQAFGRDKSAREKQVNSILKDANRAIFSVTKTPIINQLISGKMTGLIINGELVKFERRKLLKTAAEVNAWMDEHRTDYRGRVRRMAPNEKAVAPEKAIKAAVRIRAKKSGEAKGAWIGAGQEIGKFQKSGSRITIGKNVANYAHKFKDGGNAGMNKSIWDPIGIITNTVKHVSSSHVLKKSAMEEALNHGAKMTIKEYEKKLERKLRKRK